MYDVLICGGKIIDGTGEEAYTGDIGILGGRIVEIGDLSHREAKEKIDATGKLVVPGFIDMHSHADVTVLIYPKMESMLRQGITTFVGCQCGQSVAPIGRWWLHNMAMNNQLLTLSDKLYPDPYDEDYFVLASSMRELMEKEFGVGHRWPTFKSWLDEIDSHGLSGNIVTLIGYSTLRVNAMLDSEGNPDGNRVPTAEEKGKIRKGIGEAMEAGAFGMSVGLDYNPGIFSKTPELTEMAGEMKDYKGIYFAHWRKTGLRAGTPKKQKKIDGIIETLEIGIENDIQVQISHLSAGYDVFPTEDDFMQVAAAQRTLEVIDEYIGKGAKANFDVIPNITGGTMINPYLVTLLKPWVWRVRGLSNFLENLKCPDYRSDIAKVIYKGEHFRLNPLILPDWDENIRIIESSNKEYLGRTLKELAAEKRQDSLERMFDLILEDPVIKIFATTHSMNAKAVQTYLNHPLATVGNDTFVFDNISTVEIDPQRPAHLPNPNTYCGFIKYIKEFGMPRIEDTIKKITSRPAEILGLSDRGSIKEGYRGDIVVMDMENMHTNENFVDPRVYPDGVVHVMVNGEFVIKNRKHTGALPGGVIKRQEK